MHIGYLADHLTHVPIVAQWIHAQWGYMNPEKTLGQRMEKLKKGATRGGIPTTIVAFYEDRLAGTASLVKHDMETHRELTPWLASVYVAQEYRNQGIGSALVRQIIKEARILSVETLYLFTFDRESFYARLGWQKICNDAYLGAKVTIMELGLADT